MLMNRDYYYHELARKVACGSECKYRFGAVLVLRGRVIAMSVNINKTHPDHVMYNRVNNPKKIQSIHAEHRVLLLAGRVSEGATLYVARDGGNGTSKPCAGCMNLLTDRRIRAIVYTVNNELTKEKLL